MDPSRIGTLAVRIRASDARPDLATRCTALARRVLDRTVELLDHGDRVVLIRKLEIRWRLPEEALDTEDAVTRLAADLIAALEIAWAAPLESPDPDANAVVFPDTATWWAEALQARAAGRVGWYHQPILDPEPLLVLAEPIHREFALAVLRHLGRQAPDVLRESPSDAVRAWADALHVVVPEALTSVDPQQAHAGLDRDPEIAALVRHVLDANKRDDDAALVGLSALALRLARMPRLTRLEAEAVAFSKALASAASVGPVTVPGEVVEPDPMTAGVPHLQPTSYAGLFYLATLLVELGTGEHLWTACLPEGQLFGWAASGLVGDDPVVRWFGNPDASMPEVTTAQAEEVIAKVCAALAGALCRYRPDAVVPPLELSLANQELIATLPHSVFPVWSAACTEPSELREAAVVLSELWPGGLAVPVAWDKVGLRGRIQAQPERAPRAWFRLDGPAPAARLGAVAIGAAAALFEWRVGEACVDSAMAFAERYLRVNGRIEDTGDALVVHLRATDVSFPLRRAGLDRDPGYVPWLERTVLLRFDGDEPEVDELPVVPDDGLR